MRRDRRPVLLTLGVTALLAIGGGSALAGCGSTHERAAAPGTLPLAGDTSPITSAATTPATVGPPPTTAPRPHVDGTPPSVVASTSTSTTTTPAAAQAAALTRLKATLPVGGYALSAVQTYANQTFVIAARNITSQQSVIDVDSYVRGQFRTVVSAIGADENLDPVSPGTIPSGRVTTSALPDFLVLLQSGGHQDGVVLSAVGGIWHTLGLADRGGVAASHELILPRLRGSYVTQAIDTCGPGCTEGTYSVTTYGYDPSSGELAQVGSTVQSSTP